MIKLFLAIVLAIAGASLALAQISPPCYTTNGSNCIKVGTGQVSGNGPMPVIISPNAVTIDTSTPTVVYISPSSVPYTYTPTSNRELNFIHIVYTSSSTVSNRQIVLSLVDTDGNTVGDWHTTPAIAASQTRHIEYMPGIYREATFDANDTVQTPFPAGLIIPANYSLIVSDATSVVTNDIMTIGLQVK
jgi:hypothetical protein